MKKRERRKGTGVTKALAEVALAADVDGYCDARYPEDMTVSDLAQAIRAKVSDAQTIARRPLGGREKRRVQVGEAFAVHVGKNWWVAGDCRSPSTQRFGRGRDARWLFCAWKAADDVRSWVLAARSHMRPHIVRVTFWRVER